MEIQKLKRKETEKRIEDWNFNFEGTNIYDIIVEGIKTIKVVNFDKATIQGSVSFQPRGENKNEIGGLSFFETIVGGATRFNSIEINGKVYFAGAKIRGVVVFDKATMKNVDFNGAQMYSASFTDVTLNGLAEFNMTVNPGTLTFTETTFARCEAAEAAYRSAKQNYEQRGDRIRADKYFYREMVARRNYKESKLLRHFEWFFLDLSMKYGTSPSRLFEFWTLLAFMIGVLTAASFAVTTGLKLDDAGLVVISSISVFAPGLSLAHSQPNILIWILSIISTITAAFFWSAFILIFSRKYMR